VLTVKNDLFSKDFSAIASAEMQQKSPKSRSLPFSRVTATREDGSKVSFDLWEDLPTVRISDDSEPILFHLTGEHWMVRAVKLNAFTDDVDTLAEENEYNFFYQGFQKPISGDIFFFEDPETDRAIVVISETPDWTRGQLSIPQRKDSAVILKNNGYPVVIGYCRRGECESLCRSYFRHVNHCNTLVTMSNTWGDCNGHERVCEEFISNEIDAAQDLGVDIVQIDDGWQLAGVAYPRHRDADGVIWEGDCWDLHVERFPNGIMPLTQKAAKLGVKVGIWFAPSGRNDFALLERDKAVMTRCYNEYGVRFFKLDMYEAPSKLRTDKFIELLEHIYSLGDDVSVQMDVTRNSRLNYLCGNEYGTIFVENRYTKTANSFPHRVLRNLWTISKYQPSNRFQFELINPDLNVESYKPTDPFAPVNYTMDYLFASVMLSNPLFWMEMQFLPKARRAELAPLMKVWKTHRAALADADVMPIGEKPSGRSLTGFYVSKNGVPEYLLLFREATDRSTAILQAPLPQCNTELLCSNADVQVQVANGLVTATFDKPRSYAFVKLSK
ncbi:MAG: alpha-galactosidase, partial [Clostridia bacterium]|nr:alpha-galactosidase [Clostridia bacterium]